MEARKDRRTARLRRRPVERPTGEARQVKIGAWNRANPVTSSRRKRIESLRQTRRQRQAYHLRSETRHSDREREENKESSQAHGGGRCKDQVAVTPKRRKRIELTKATKKTEASLPVRHSNERRYEEKEQGRECGPYKAVK
ncbi:hypothetical protein PoB_006686800 [Plakobranchus ocellatus]|uniref:Uncharacterized protein n=1 Tax=Plakobranchus ocellatus TaxID=259542 RepID=A0AAV4D811_9GAST|nr:hypothetical protein PoB_006686800 [Plakobranchus ocellatus]